MVPKCFLLLPDIRSGKPIIFTRPNQFLPDQFFQVTEKSLRFHLNNMITFIYMYLLIVITKPRMKIWIQLLIAQIGTLNLHFQDLEIK